MISRKRSKRNVLPLVFNMLMLLTVLRVKVGKIAIQCRIVTSSLNCQWFQNSSFKMKIKARVTRLLVVEFRLCKKLDISIMKHHLRNLQNVSNKYLLPIVLTLKVALPSQYSFLQDHNRCTRARCAFLCEYFLLLTLSKFLPNEFLAGNSLKRKFPK